MTSGCPASPRDPERGRLPGCSSAGQGHSCHAWPARLVLGGQAAFVPLDTLGFGERGIVWEQAGVSAPLGHLLGLCSATVPLMSLLSSAGCRDHSKSCLVSSSGRQGWDALFLASLQGRALPLCQTAKASPCKHGQHRPVNMASITLQALPTPPCEHCQHHPLNTASITRATITLQTWPASLCERGPTDCRRQGQLCCPGTSLLGLSATCCR